MNAIHFGADGWRARYGEGFTEENVEKVAYAVAQAFTCHGKRGTFYIGYDTRTDGDSYAEVAARVVAGCGLRVAVSATYCPTPALGWTIACDSRAIGGLMITASHNDASYNGIKVRMADGGAAPKDVTDVIEDAATQAPPPARGSFDRVDLMTPYLDDLKTLVNAEAIRSARLKVVVDPLHGAARGYLARLMRSLGVEAAELHGTASGNFGGLRPDPIEPWTHECASLVRATEAHAGFVLDADADRGAVVGGDGVLVSPHRIIALVMELLVRGHGAAGRVVTTTAGSELVRRQAERLGCPVVQTPIGFRWVYGEMLKHGVLLGGEESGGIGVPSHLVERDALYISLLLCELMAVTGKTLDALSSELVAELGTMEYGRRDIELDGVSFQMLSNVLSGINPGSVEGMQPSEVHHKDGLHLRFPNGSWLLVRLSDNESAVRIYAEAPTRDERDALLDAGHDLVDDYI